MNMFSYSHLSKYYGAAGSYVKDLRKMSIVYANLPNHIPSQRLLNHEIHF